MATCNCWNPAHNCSECHQLSYTALKELTLYGITGLHVTVTDKKVEVGTLFGIPVIEDSSWTMEANPT